MVRARKQSSRGAPIAAPSKPEPGFFEQFPTAREDLLRTGFCETMLPAVDRIVADFDNHRIDAKEMSRRMMVVRSAPPPKVELPPGKTWKEIAFHEAGHAVVQCLFCEHSGPGRWLLEVRIGNRHGGDLLGMSRVATRPREKDRRAEAEKNGCGVGHRVEQMIELAAGPVAQAIFLGKPISTEETFDVLWSSAESVGVGEGADEALITRLALGICDGDENEAEPLIGWVYGRAANMIRRPAVWAAIRQVATELLRSPGLPVPGKKVRDLIRQAANDQKAIRGAKADLRRRGKLADDKSRQEGVGPAGRRKKKPR